MINNNQYTLKEVINELLKVYQLKGKIMENQLINSWEKVCGTLINRHTEKLYLNNKKLYVKVDSAALCNELIYSKTKIINALNNSVKENIIDDIIFL